MLMVRHTMWVIYPGWRLPPRNVEKGWFDRFIVLREGSILGRFTPFQHGPLGQRRHGRIDV